MSIILNKYILFKTNGRCSWARIVRFLSDKKKFYKEAQVCQTDGGFQINLDKRKLRTPAGALLNIPSEELAHAVAFEWNVQKDVIKINQMTLTALCYAALDSSTTISKQQLAASALKYFSTDTLLCHSQEPLDLAHLQEEQWGSVVEWFKSQYSVSVKSAVGFEMPRLSPETHVTMKNHLLSYNYWSLIGLETMVGVLKSMILSLAVTDRHLNIEKAVCLSRLEQEFQISKWGNVEWHHDIELHEMRMKTSACALFIHMCCEESKCTQYRDISTS